MPNPYPYKNLEENPFYMELAKSAYGHYGAVVDFKNFQGNPMPSFDELLPNIRRAWHDATRFAYNQGAAAEAAKGKQ